MRSYMALASVFCLFEFSTPAYSQAPSTSTATGTGIGIGAARSDSQSNAVAVSGQGGQGGAGGAGGRGGQGGRAQSNLTINGGSTPSATSASVSSTAAVRSSTDETVRNVPLVASPGLTAAGVETCLGSVSGGVGVVGFGGSFGTTVPDPDCTARLDARALANIGMAKGALVRLCLQPKIYQSIPEECDKYMPVPPPSVAAPYPGPGPLIPGSLIMFLRGAFESLPPTSTEAPPSAADASAAETYHNRSIELVESKMGKTRTCSDYDATRRYCRAWAREPQMAAKRK